MPHSSRSIAAAAPRGFRISAVGPSFGECQAKGLGPPDDEVRTSPKVGINRVDIGHKDLLLVKLVLSRVGFGRRCYGCGALGSHSVADRVYPIDVLPI
jgi:hypothetical protein